MTKPPSASPENEIFEWQCPYCDQTRQNLGDLREHITDSTDDDHRGIDGLKPTQDLVAFGTNGEEVDRVEGVSTGPADSLESYDKREIIINAWLAADRDPDRQAVKNVSGASQQYVSRLINELNSGEIPRETWIEALDYGLRDYLDRRLDDWGDTNIDTEDTMSTQATTEDIIDASTKKDRIIATHRVSPSLDKKTAADALDVSYEYVRQIFKDIEDRDQNEWEKLREGDLDEDPSPELLDAVETRLREAGAVTPTDRSTESDEREYDERWEPQGESAASVSGAVPVEDVQAVRERMELLLEQAEYTQSEDAEFVAKKGLQWLDDLLESAE